MFESYISHSEISSNCYLSESLLHFQSSVFWEGGDSRFNRFFTREDQTIARSSLMVEGSVKPRGLPEFHYDFYSLILQMQTEAIILSATDLKTCSASSSREDVTYPPTDILLLLACVYWAICKKTRLVAQRENCTAVKAYLPASFKRPTYKMIL